MNAGHTKGPWAIHSTARAIVPLGDAYKPVTVDGSTVYAEDGARCLFLFADPRDGLPEEETYANAFLAAAAPDLLLVAQMVCDVVSNPAPHASDRVVQFASVLTNARAAISKARGEA